MQMFCRLLARCCATERVLLPLPLRPPCRPLPLQTQLLWRYQPSAGAGSATRVQRRCRVRAATLHPSGCLPPSVPAAVPPAEGGGGSVSSPRARVAARREGLLWGARQASRGAKAPAVPTKPRPVRDLTTTAARRLMLTHVPRTAVAAARPWCYRANVARPSPLLRRRPAASAGVGQRLGGYGPCRRGYGCAGP